MISVTCTQCGMQLEVPLGMAGQTRECSCGAIVTLPGETHAGGAAASGVGQSSLYPPGMAPPSPSQPTDTANNATPPNPAAFVQPPDAPAETKEIRPANPVAMAPPDPAQVVQPPANSVNVVPLFAAPTTPAASNPAIPVSPAAPANPGAPLQPLPPVTADTAQPLPKLDAHPPTQAYATSSQSQPVAQPGFDPLGAPARRKEQPPARDEGLRYLRYEQRHNALLSQLQGSIPEVPKTAEYRRGILWASIVMVLLPVVYGGAVLMLGGSLLSGAVSGLWLVTALGPVGFLPSLFVYLMFLAMGGMLFLGMLKPLFAWRSQYGRTRSLYQGDEPLLFAFVKRLCQLTGAPEPYRIDIDCDLNASASFEGGILSSSKLVLTIGAPLAAGLSLRGFTGVLAHELGHFGQGAGMKLSYIVRVINMWLARAVYEPDVLDELFAHAHERLGMPLNFLLMPFTLPVVTARGLMWLLMSIGNRASSSLMREMEYDADQYEMLVAGSKTFENTVYRLRELGVAYSVAQESIIDFLLQGKFPDNFTQYMFHVREQMADYVIDGIHQEVANEETGKFETHPCDKDRIAAARAMNAAGLFQIDEPVAALFTNFQQLEQTVTWDIYQQLGAPILPHEMTPNQFLINERDNPTPTVQNNVGSALIRGQRDD